MTQAAKTIKIIEARQLASSGAGRMIRQAAGLSLADIARVCEVDPSAVFRWETGERRPSGDRAVTYGQFLCELRDRHTSRRKAAA